MINPDIISKADEFFPEGKYTTISIKNTSRYDYESYDIYDDKDFKKYIADIERLVRNSFEYRQLMGYLRNTEGMSVCSFLSNVTSIDTKMRIEIHHSPFTLFDIVLTVVKKRQDHKESLDILDVSEEVMWLHYMGYVGLIPLSQTVHEMVHNGYIFIPVDKVRGNYVAFLNGYKDYIEPDTLDTLSAVEKATEKYNNEQMQIFNQHKIYVNANGNYNLPSIKFVEDELKIAIARVKNQGKPIEPIRMIQ